MHLCDGEYGTKDVDGSLEQTSASWVTVGHEIENEAGLVTIGESVLGFYHLHHSL